MTPPPPDWTDVIRRCGRELPAWIVRRVRELGPAAREPLVLILRSNDPPDEPSRPGDFAAQHAAALLAELEPDDALIDECLARIRADPGTPLCHVLVELLVRAGPRVVPATLAAYARIGDDEVYEAGHLADVLSRCGAHDEAVFAALVDALLRFPAEVAGIVGHYGDVRAIEPLLAALGAYEAEVDDDLFDDDVAFGVESSVAMLGGTLPDDLQTKVDRARDLRERWLDDDLDDLDDDVDGEWSRPPQPLPNAPCWCGSERKYKKCHMAADEAETAGD